MLWFCSHLIRSIYKFIIYDTYICSTFKDEFLTRRQLILQSLQKHFFMNTGLLPKFNVFVFCIFKGLWCGEGLGIQSESYQRKLRCERHFLPVKWNFWTEYVIYWWRESGSSLPGASLSPLSFSEPGSDACWTIETLNSLRRNCWEELDNNNVLDWSLEILNMKHIEIAQTLLEVPLLSSESLASMIVCEWSH